MEGTPNFWQKDPKAHFPNDGQEYSGPIAVSNALIYLGKHGFQRLIPSAQNEYSAQEKLIKTLASKNYIQITPEINTNCSQVIAGILKFPTTQGYRAPNVQYRGAIRKAPFQFYAGDTPSLSWMCKSALGNSCEILVIGWYRYDPKHNVYIRTHSHFVNVVGYAEFKGDLATPPALIVHDAATGKELLLKVERLNSGSLQTNKADILPRQAAGMYKIINGNNQPNNTVAIIEGAIIFRL